MPIIGRRCLKHYGSQPDCDVGLSLQPCLNGDCITRVPARGIESFVSVSCYVKLTDAGDGQGWILVQFRLHESTDCDRRNRFVSSIAHSFGCSQRAWATRALNVAKDKPDGAAVEAAVPAAMPQSHRPSGGATSRSRSGGGDFFSSRATRHRCLIAVSARLNQNNSCGIADRVPNGSCRFCFFGIPSV